jgi:hypothetical protein
MYADVMSEKTFNLVTREEYEAIQQQMEGRITDLTDSSEPRVQRQFRRQKVAEVYDEVFELIGGVRRFALWANMNETEYYKMFGRMLPTGQQDDKNASSELVIKHVLPPTRLDRLEDLENPDG